MLNEKLKEKNWEKHVRLGQDIETFLKISDCFLDVYHEQLICRAVFSVGKNLEFLKGCD